jgi:ankyrin repeat protein
MCDLTGRLGKISLGLLLATGATLGAASGDPRVADAVKNRDMNRVRALLKEHADVNAPQGDGTTAVHWAAHWNDLDTTHLLIGAGANVNAATDHGISPLMLACTNGNVAIVEALVKAGAHVNAAGETGETALMACSRSGNAGAVNALLARGADVNAHENEHGQTPLMWAAAQDHPEVVKALIEHGADVGARTKTIVFKAANPEGEGRRVPPDRGGYTAILFAARQGAADAVDVLLAKGANVNDVTADGTSVLVAATYTGHWDLAKALLDKGANPNLATAGYTPLHWMSGTWDGHFTGLVGTERFPWVGARGPGKLELVKALLAHGADPNARMAKRPPQFGFGGGFFRADYTGATPFIFAALAGDAEVMRTLLAAGADPLLTAKDGSTALMAAAGLGRDHGESRVTPAQGLEACKLAVEVGVPVNAANRNGQTALHGAAYFEMNELAQFLLDHGANVNARNVSGETPLTIAYGYDSGGGIRYSESLAEMLRKAGGVEVMEFKAVLKSVEAPCPTPTLMVSVNSGAAASAEYGGNRVRLVTDAATKYGNGACGDLKAGIELKVTATRLGYRLDKNGQSWNGSLDVSQIELSDSKPSR